MDHDLLIKGGTVIDGGRITRVGEIGESNAARTIDATGKLVTPGFIDLHTHLDAQVGWDPELRSSSYHGVTTVLMGNCGVSFAPARPENHRYLAEIMQSVEDIPADQIMEGLPWNWSSYGEYLDAVQKMRPALNIVGMAGHSPIRFEAMGDRAMDEGGMVPGTWADSRETEAIQRTLVATGGRGTVYQQVSDFATRMENEIQILECGAELGCHVLFSNARHARVFESPASGPPVRAE
jgi:N-acyl-D-amino-acid deacylase